MIHCEPVQQRNSKLPGAGVIAKDRCCCRSAQRPLGVAVAGARILVVEARFYDDIADALLAGATRVLEQAKVSFDRISVPGSLEIPGAIAIALDAAERRGQPYDGVVALGCVIRGDTIHFELVSMESARALVDLSVARALPHNAEDSVKPDTEIRNMYLMPSRPASQPVSGVMIAAATM